jgi:hypothetical protein
MGLVNSSAGGRMAFQVLRDGSLVMTARADGELIDQQINLTGLLRGPTFIGDVSAVSDSAGAVSVFGRDTLGGLALYQFNPIVQSWSARSLGAAPSGSGILVGDPRAFHHASRGATALVTTNLGHLVLYSSDVGPIDLTASATGDASPQVYASVGITEDDHTVFAYGTDQQGGLIEYRIAIEDGSVAVRRVALPSGRETMVFQAVSAVESAGTRHVFATDGNGRVVHVEVGPDGDSAENVTELSGAAALGYAPYQQPFAGRVLSGLAALKHSGELVVFGTNSRDLIEFRKPPGGTWSARNLTNLLPANRVFGAPAAYVLPNGDIHALQVNENAEVIEYYFWTVDGRYHTQNITRARGNSGSPPDFPPREPAAAPGAVTVSQVAVPPLLSPAVKRDDHANRPGRKATRIVMTAAAPSGFASGAIERRRDRDVFQFTAAATGRIAIGVSTPFSALDARLILLNSQRRRIAHSHDLHGDAHVELEVVAGKSYFVLVDGKRNSVGSYDIALDSLEQQIGAVAALRSQAPAILKLGQITHAGEEVLYRVSAVSSGVLQLQVSPAAGELDPVLDVYDSSGMRLAHGGSGGSGAACVAIQFTPGQSYFVRVHGQRHSTGRYELGLDWLLENGLQTSRA